MSIDDMLSKLKSKVDPDSAPELTPEGFQKLPPGWELDRLGRRRRIAAAPVEQAPKGRKWSEEDFKLRGVKPRDASRVQASIQFPPELRKRARELAAARGVTLSDFICELVKEAQ